MARIIEDAVISNFSFSVHSILGKIRIVSGLIDIRQIRFKTDNLKNSTNRTSDDGPFTSVHEYTTVDLLTIVRSVVGYEFATVIVVTKVQVRSRITRTIRNNDDSILEIIESFTPE